MRFTILQLCCFDCMRFQNIYFTNKNLLSFIDKIISDSDDEYCYFIVYYNGKKTLEFDTMDFIKMYYGEKNEIRE